MNISFNSFSNYTIHFLKDNFLPSLTAQQKKTAVIAAAIFGSLLACYLVMTRCCFKAVPVPNDSKENEQPNDQNENVSQTKISEQSDKKMFDKKSKNKNTQNDSQDSKGSSKDSDPSIEKPTSSPFPSPKEKHEEKTKEIKPSIDLNIEESINKAKSDFEEKEDTEVDPSIGLNVKETDEEISTTSPLTPAPSSYVSPHLLDYGVARKGTDGGAPPDLIGITTGNITVIETEKEWAAVFYCWIHTTESQAEIIQGIKNICMELDHFPNPQKTYLESFVRFYNNSVKLHDALPGDPTQKVVKIYWNENAEKILLPHFLKQDNVIIDNLLFAFVRDEIVHSPFQAPFMDFKNQLQFVGLDKDNIMQNLQDELKRLSQAVLGQDIFKEIENEIEKEIEWSTSLMQNAQIFTMQNNLRIQLLAMEAKSKSIDFEGMDPDERSKFLQGLFR